MRFIVSILLSVSCLASCSKGGDGTSVAEAMPTDLTVTSTVATDNSGNVNFVATQKLGADREWELSARWNLGSGLPFTQTQGYYQPNVLNGVGISSDYIASNSNEIIYYTT